MTEQEAIKEVGFNMSTIGLNNKSKERVIKARDIAIKALEKQITRKVIYARTSGGQSGYLCPVCENYLDHTIPNYCCKCGQKIELGQWD